MKAKHVWAKKTALNDHAERCYLYGFDDALKHASELLKSLGKTELAILVKAIGSAEIEENQELDLK